MGSSDLKRSAFSGMVWKMLERMGSQIVSLIVSIVLARLLIPEDYSVVSIVTVFFAFCNVFITGGLNTALIQKKDADEEDYSSVLYISVFVAFIIYAILFFAAPWISRLYDQPILIPVFRVMGIALLIDAIKAVLCAYISNKLQFRKFFLATLGGISISAVVGVYMALHGFGPWALVAQRMTNSLIDTVILFISTKFKIRLVFSWKKLKGLFGYGWKIFVASLITTIYEQINPLVIGIRFSSSDLAFYSKGRSYPALLDTSVCGSVSAVLFPVMSKVQTDKEAMLNYTRKFISVSSYLVFPILIGFAAVSDAFVLLLFTEKWMPVAPYVKVFCITFMFNIIQTGNLQTIRALGRSDIILKLEIIKKAVYFVVTIISIMCFRNPLYLALSTVVNTLIATFINTAPNKKLIGYSLRHQIVDIVPNFLISGAMGIVVYAIRVLPISTYMLLGVQVASGIILYIGLSLLTRNPNVFYLYNTIKSFIKERK